MARPLPSPVRPLPRADFRWTWAPESTGAQRPWFRVYHQASHTPDGVTFRSYGPLHRFDHHTPPFRAPALDPAGRSVLYVGEDLATAACEVFGQAGVAPLCSRRRISQVVPTREVQTYAMDTPGAAMALGALPALADADLPRERTQEWARAIYEDQPAREKIEGIRYRTAYYGGTSLVLWDCPDAVAVARDAAGQPLVLPLVHDAVRLRLVKALLPLNIPVTLVADTSCRECVDDPL
ncbi:RES family NAD+ phosphorylase [Rhodococcus pyridinivorans]|uniref:RES family NAD+ phosphorylase n=1 Tax=Rhodococcus pyridinivorans TaxID=103816 RepID=UPI003AAFA41B